MGGEDPSHLRGSFKVHLLGTAPHGVLESLRSRVLDEGKEALDPGQHWEVAEEGASPCYQECQEPLDQHGACTSGMTDTAPGLLPIPGEEGSATLGSFCLFNILSQLGQSSGKLGCFQGKRGSTSLCCVVVTETKLASVLVT